jgi:hypothetical protein
VRLKPKVPQKTIDSQLQHGRIKAFGHRVKQLPTETVQRFVRTIINTMILVRQIAMFSEKVVLTTTINRKKVLPGLQIMFTDKVNPKGQIRPEAERRTDRGVIQIQKIRVRQLQTEEEQVGSQFPKHANIIM